MDTPTNILVACHNQIILYDTQTNTILNKSHYWDTAITYLINIFNLPTKTITFETIDILSGGNIEGDIYTLPNSKNKYKMIILPDCSGDWFNIQSLTRTTEPSYYKIMQFVSINIPKLLELLTNDGILVLSKFVDSVYGIFFKNWLIRYFITNNKHKHFIIFYKTQKPWNINKQYGDAIIIIKNKPPPFYQNLPKINCNIIDKYNNIISEIEIPFLNEDDIIENVEDIKLPHPPPNVELKDNKLPHVENTEHQRVENIEDIELPRVKNIELENTEHQRVENIENTEHQRVENIEDTKLPRVENIEDTKLPRVENIEDTKLPRVNGFSNDTCGDCNDKTNDCCTIFGGKSKKRKHSKKRKSRKYSKKRKSRKHSKKRKSRKY